MQKFLFLVAFSAVSLVAPLDVFAQAASQPTPGGFLQSTIWFVLVLFFMIFWLIIRPAAQKEEQQKKFLESLKRNDEVMISSGIYGRVSQVKPGAISIEVASGVILKVDPQHVHAVVAKDDKDKAAQVGKEAK